MAKKTVKVLQKDLEKLVDGFKGAITDSVAGSVAYTVRQRMLSQIAKGISPITGDRFPEYKAVTRRNAARATRATIRELMRSTSRKAQASLRKRLAAIGEERGYPFSVQDKYPDKKPRPVNLKLSGDFLKSLTYQTSKRSGGQNVEIGFYDKESIDKELGHRGETNRKKRGGEQPKRPIIPVGTETFNRVIQLDIIKLMRDAFNAYMKKVGV